MRDLASWPRVVVATRRGLALGTLALSFVFVGVAVSCVAGVPDPLEMDLTLGCHEDWEREAFGPWGVEETGPMGLGVCYPSGWEVRWDEDSGDLDVGSDEWGSVIVSVPLRLGLTPESELETRFGCQKLANVAIPGGIAKLCRDTEIFGGFRAAYGLLLPEDILVFVLVDGAGDKEIRQAFRVAANVQVFR